MSEVDPLAEYDALVAKVSAAVAAHAQASADALACVPGCAGCCGVELSLSEVESAALTRALGRMPVGRRQALAARAAKAPAEPRCALLDDSGRCEAYDARPLVCRSQGLALRYPPGFIPASAVLSRIPSGEVTACPLNFRARLPTPPEILDAEKVDLLLALVDHRYRRGEDGSRTLLRALVARSAR